MNVTEKYLQKFEKEAQWWDMWDGFYVDLEDAKRMLQEFEIALKKELEHEADKRAQKVDGCNYY